MATTLKTRLAAAGLVAAVTVPGSLVLAAPAHADDDLERGGRCAGAEWELNVDRERRGFDVDADLDDARPGSTWRVVLRHEGKVFYDRVRTADRDGEISVDRWRGNTAGKDTFSVALKPTGAGSTCGARIVTR